MSSFLEDLRYAFRTLRKNPILTAVALLSLGIGIGANTAIFTVMDRLLLRSLPIRDPERVVMFVSQGPQSGFVETSYGNYVSFSWPKYRALRDRSSELFEGVLARFPFEVSVAAKGQTDRTRGELVSGNYFTVLGVRPALGRLIADDDARTRGGSPVAVLSYGYFTRRFGGDAAILNQSITVNGESLTVIGVAQAGFQSIGAGEAPAVFVPITMQGHIRTGFDQFENSHAYWLNIFGRLKPGVPREKAEAGVEVIWRAVLRDDVAQFPSSSADLRQKYLDRKLELRPGGAGLSAIREDFSLPLYLLMGMVGLVLLIACANVANLLLARAAARSKEIAIRLALGATRARLIRHVMAESAILSLGGGLAGLLIAAWARALMLRMVPEGIPIAGVDSDPDGRVLAFALGVSILTGLLFGCVPALRATRPDLAGMMKEQSATASAGRHARFRKTLVVGQIALSLLLLASAGLFAHSLYNLGALDAGFRSDRLLAFAIDPQLTGYTPERTQRLFAEIREGLLATPGVGAASMARLALLTNSQSMSAFIVEGWDNGKHVVINNNRVGSGFFSTMGIPLMAGREFRESDNLGAPRVAVINESAAKKFFEGRNPIGQHLNLRRDASAATEIVGIVKDSKSDDLREKPRPVVYLAAAQDAAPGGVTFYVRSAVPPESLSGSVRQVVRRLDANLPVTGPKAMREQIQESVFIDRMVAALAGAFASLATVLAAIGLYGVIAWAVTQRKREIGIRMALGANPADVMRMVLREVLWLAGSGLAIAGPLWAMAARLLSSGLYGLSAYDPVTLAAAVAILVVVAGAAGFIPAFRAARIDPNLAIRYE